MTLTFRPALEYVGILSKLDPSSHGALRETLAALFVTNTSHIFSVFLFYHLTITLWPNRPFFALTSSVLHIFSPAGLFLSAPYAESCFAALAFAGWLLLARSCRSEDNALLRDTYIVLAGVVFGLATVFRSNGVLNGIPFAWEMVRLLPRLGHRPVDTMRRLLALGVGGVCVALGSVVPQAVAWMRFCSDGVGDVRPWCKAYLPSIYAFVQKYYWYVAVRLRDLSHVLTLGQGCWLSPVLATPKSPVIPSRRSYDHDYAPVGHQLPHPTPNLRLQQTRRVSPLVAANPVDSRCSGDAGCSGRDELSCSDHHTHFIWVPIVVLVGCRATVK